MIRVGGHKLIRSGIGEKIGGRFPAGWTVLCSCGWNGGVVNTAMGAYAEHRQHASTAVTIPRLSFQSGKETDFGYLSALLANLNDDQTLPWHTYPCIEWDRGMFITGGYGRVHYAGAGRKVHRVAFFLTNGDLSQVQGKVRGGTKICHHCDNPLCFRPIHLFSGTTADNSRDKVNKERQARGESHGRAKVTAEQVREIRRLYEEGVSQMKLAKIFPLVQPVISSIIRREIWGHID